MPGWLSTSLRWGTHTGMRRFRRRTRSRHRLRFRALAADRAFVRRSGGRARGPSREDRRRGANPVALVAPVKGDVEDGRRRAIGGRVRLRELLGVVSYISSSGMAPG